MPPAKVQATPRRIYLPMIDRPTPEPIAALREDHGDPRCIWCGRTRSTHAAPVDLGGGETMVPACERINGGGRYPSAGSERLPRPLRARLELAMALPLERARAIAGTLGQPSKMPGAAYGIDAFQCRKGGELVGDPESTCSGCYARRNFYLHWHAAVKARGHRQRAIRHPLWTEAMIALILDYVERGGEPAFRWHDSGDLHGAWHLASICAVAEAIPSVRFWLPTREYDDVVEYLRAGGVIPSNLTVRLSAHYKNRTPEVPAELAHLPTSTTHDLGQTPPLRRKGAIVCHAIDSPVNMCRRCRACWDPRVTNVSYRMH